MRETAAKRKALPGVLLAAAALLLAGDVEAFRTGSASGLERERPRNRAVALHTAGRGASATPIAGDVAGDLVDELAAAYEPSGFELLSADDREAITRQPGLKKPWIRTPAPSFALEPSQELTSGLQNWQPTFNIWPTRELAAVSPLRAAYDHRARMYDPATATFLGPDPLGPVDSPNLYQAFGLDGMNVTDPYGLREPSREDLRQRKQLEGLKAEQIAAYKATGTLAGLENVTEADYAAFETAWRGTLGSFDAAVEEADESDFLEHRHGKFFDSSRWGTRSRGFAMEKYSVATPMTDAVVLGVATIMVVGPDAVALAGMPYAMPGGGRMVEQQAMTPGLTLRTKREQYMGKTPGKGSRTGREVIDRMMKEGTIVEAEGGAKFLADEEGGLTPLTETDMSHLEDAVKWWNREGYKYGPKSEQVRIWMLNPDNYELEASSTNRSSGAQLPDRYRPPEPSR